MKTKPTGGSPALAFRALVMLACLFALAVGPAHADDAAMSGAGGSVGLMHPSHPTISMLSEVVRIDNLPYGHVRAFFTFRNDGPSCTVRIGFPGRTWGESGTPDLSEFHSWIDAKPAKVKRIAESPDQDGQTIWYVKTVSFGPRQTRMVIDDYCGGGGEYSNGDEMYGYQLHTGASWHGPIRQGEIIVDESGLSTSVPSLRPDNFVLKGHTAVWKFKNVKPSADDDILITWTPQRIGLTINGSSVVDDDWVTRTCRRRGIELWVPARTAAGWLGASITPLPNGVYRVRMATRWFNFVSGSPKLVRSHGRPITLPYPINIDNGEHMIGLIGLIRALDGMAHFDKTGSLIATLPGWKPAAQQPNR